MSFKEYMKMLLQLIPIFLLLVILGIGISQLSFAKILFPIVYLILFPFITIKYIEWIIDKFD